jgi:NAD(P)-dependent dehydrogenase (short-subunit alcohol dehydrogenase family)
MSLERKVLVVTGSSQGLGAAFVKAYTERGWRVETRVK